MIKNKRGQEFSLNTIVIAIIVVVVLIVVVSFFLFGFKGLTDRVKSIFFGTTAGTDRTLAIQQCNNFCDQAALLTSEALVKSSPYCTYSFKIDADNNGEAEVVAGTDPKQYVDFYCTRNGKEGQNLGVPCTNKIGEKPIQEICFSLF